MNAEQLIKLLLELDQQVVSPRPSAWGRAAELVAVLCDHAEPSLRDGRKLGDWRSVDLAGVHRRSPSELNQPTLDAIQEESGGLPIARMVKDAGEAEKLAGGLSLHSEERVYLGDLSCHVFALAERVRELEAEREAARASSEMMIGGMDTLILEDRNKADECGARVRALEGELKSAKDFGATMAPREKPWVG